MKKYTSISTGMSNYCQSSLKLYLVSLFEFVLEQIKTVQEYFIDIIAIGGRENIPMISREHRPHCGIKDKLTYITSRLPYQHIDYAWK